MIEDTYTSIDHIFESAGEKSVVTFADEVLLVAFCVISPEDDPAW